MRVVINSTKGVEVLRDGSGVEIEGSDYRDAPFKGAWDDVYAVLHEGTGNDALTYEAYRDTGFFMRFFRHNQNDIIFMTYQLPHMWDATTPVFPHMHCIPMASGSGTVVFDYAYAWTTDGYAFPASSGWVSGSISSSWTPDDQYVQRIMRVGPISPPPEAEASSILIFKLARNPTADSYETSKDHGTSAANVGVLFFDLHYRKDKAGSSTEYPH